MHVRVGIPCPIVMTARHLAKRAPSFRYSVNRSRSPSKPSVILSTGKFAMALAPLSTLIPGTIRCWSSTSTKLRPSRDFCRMVSSNRITPLMNSPAPLVVNKISRYIRRFSSVEGTLMLLRRFSIVPELSSAARIPLPGATSFLATDSKLSVFMILLLFVEKSVVIFLAKSPKKSKRKPAASLPPCERFPSTRSLSCVIRNFDVGQDHDFSGGGCRAGGIPNGIRCAIMHPCQRAKSEGLSIALLCRRNVLYHVG